MKKITTATVLLSLLTVNSYNITANASLDENNTVQEYNVISSESAPILSQKNYEVNTLEDFLTKAKAIVQEKKQNSEINNQALLNQLPAKNMLLNNIEDPAVNKEISPVESELLENTNPEVIRQYTELLAKEISEFSIDEDKVPAGDSEVTYILPLSGAQITVTATSELIEADLAPSGMQTMASVNRPFGTYSYKVAHKITAALYPDSTCGLVTTYTTKADGLRLTSASKAGTMGIIPTTIVASASAIDSRAEKIGYDINAQGDYVVTIAGYNGVGLVTFDVTLTSTVRWDSSTSSSLKVTEKYSQVGDASKG